ncbi:hypothetical protein [Candidatus Formimonas warabiya]|uniref:hypothetical protein n=1 Tax=Formimonas warabiya TaxID=1761012 RepID=UPI0011D11280|nr:hypothetical protein [Candidatus Formimonas warabiya]
MRLYKLFSLSAAALFALVGLVFLFFPDAALIFFNRFSVYFGLPRAPLPGTGFYLILASAYMYLVALLAILMYRYPEQNIYPFLLAQGKLASSVISIYLFLMHQPYLIYFVNFVVDGLIGIAALYLMKMKKTEV